MTSEQIKAAESLRRALRRAGKAGLQGGVCSGSFCIWPLGQHPEDKVTYTTDFFSVVEDVGLVLDQADMHLDGGAGT